MQEASRQLSHTGTFSRRQVFPALVLSGLTAHALGLPVAGKGRGKKKGPGQQVYTRTFANAGAIQVPAPVKDWGAGDVYPSAIVVSGLRGATVEKVTVTIPNLTHPNVDDVSLLLVKDAVNAVLMVQAGGDNPAVNLKLTFDDAASTPAPDEAALESGSYRPVTYLDAAYLPGQFDLPPALVSGNTLLSTFQGSDPNGSWHLYASDNGDNGLSGTLAAGWEITLTLAMPRRRKKRNRRKKR